MFDKRIYLKCYTFEAAEIFQKIFDKAPSFFPTTPMHLYHGGQLWTNSNIYISDTKELYICMDDDYDLTFEDIFIMTKCFLKMLKIGCKLANSIGLLGKITNAKAAKQDDILFKASCIIKHWSGEILTEQELNVVGQPLDPFKQSEFKGLLDLFDDVDYQNKIYVRDKILSYINEN